MGAEKTKELIVNTKGIPAQINIMNESLEYLRNNATKLESLTDSLCGAEPSKDEKVQEMGSSYCFIGEYEKQNNQLAGLVARIRHNLERLDALLS